MKKQPLSSDLIDIPILVKSNEDFVEMKEEHI